MKDTSPNLPTETSGHTGETLSKESQEIRQSKDRPVAVSMEGERESPSIQMMNEDRTSRSAGKPLTSDAQTVQHDGGNKLTDKDATDYSAEPINASESANMAHPTAEDPTARHTSTEKGNIPAQKPRVPHVPTEIPSVPHIPAEKSSAPHIPAEKQSVPHIPAEKPSVPHVPAEKLSFSSSEVPVTAVPNTASQPVHESDLREDKLGFSKESETSHSERPESIDMKLLVRQMSSKEPVGGTEQDTYTNQERNKVEESQIAQTPDSATQSAGKVPKEASMLGDKSAPKLSESVVSASRTSASKQKKVTYCVPFLQSVF
jgi:hypothetical protein